MIDVIAEAIKPYFARAGLVDLDAEDAAWKWINDTLDYEDKHGYANAYTVRELI